ncbi:MAG: 4-hydroxy-3-methylbut-2-enyl diphosphate reductase [Candidatus Omnitrophica bacterium]|nr:4-hydroxy-3-methylbut-2-enyl diphosphate reductase [Candidatus Omnitrophota bacterium]
MRNKRNSTNLLVSRHSGFCFGVRRALRIAEDALKTHRRVFSLGPIIHNPQVVNEFSKKGLITAKNTRGIKNEKGVTVLVPSHGINPEVLKKKRFSYIDTTCPLVGRVQKIVKDLKRRGYFIIIVGNKKHPEVRGLSGIAGKNSLVLKDKFQAKAFNIRGPHALQRRRLALIAQTTAAVSNFREILSEIAKKDFTELISFNTVCKNTTDRENEARRLAQKADAMIIIGGKQSANTSKLADTCKKVNKFTYHIESKDDLNNVLLKRKKKIGIATGASTPIYAINEVIEKIRGKVK